MTETTTLTLEIEVPVVSVQTKLELGRDMLLCGLSEWERYDDEGNFVADSVLQGYRVFDPDSMDEPKVITYVDFFDAHFKLIWLAQIDNYRHDWINFAFRQGKDDMDSYDNYDSLTCEAVLQNLLYGEIVYA